MFSVLSIAPLPYGLACHLVIRELDNGVFPYVELFLRGGLDVPNLPSRVGCNVEGARVDDSDPPIVYDPNRVSAPESVITSAASGTPAIR